MAECYDLGSGDGADGVIIARPFVNAACGAAEENVEVNVKKQQGVDPMFFKNI